MPIIDKVQLERTRIGHEWQRSVDGVTVRFVGRLDGAALQSPWPLTPSAGRATVPRQVHSASVRTVPPLASALPADALTTHQPGTILLVVTADCVPLLATDGVTAVAIHAGWRGIASQVVPRALKHLDRGRAWKLWIGPHIGACCYEVGDEVAEQVVEASTARARIDGNGRKPHLDLLAAVIAQADLGDGDHLTEIEGCTRCNPDRLHSYRRDGAGAGRNLAVVGIGG